MVTVPVTEIVAGEPVAPALAIVIVPAYVPAVTPVKRTEIVFETLAVE